MEVPAGQQINNKVQEFSWKTVDGLKLHGKLWAPDGDVQGVVCLIHGFGEHADRYAGYANVLNASGYGVIGFDLRGHGRSEGKKGHIPSFDHLLNDVDDLLNKGGEFFPEAPQVLLGHSMGGNIVLNYTLQRQPSLSGVIVSAPWLKLAEDPPKARVAVGRLMRKIYPAYQENTKLNAEAISSIPEEVEKYKNDPLVHSKITTQLFFSVLEQCDYALRHATDFHLPLLIYHGTGDQLISYEGSKEFAQKAKQDVTFKLFEGGYHEIHNDVQRNEMFELVVQWLGNHVKTH